MEGNSHYVHSNVMSLVSLKPVSLQVETNVAAMMDELMLSHCFVMDINQLNNNHNRYANNN
jgi:hypothetical protein